MAFNQLNTLSVSIARRLFRINMMQFRSPGAFACLQLQALSKDDYDNRDLDVVIVRRDEAQKHAIHMRLRKDAWSEIEMDLGDGPQKIKIEAVIAPNVIGEMRQPRQAMATPDMATQAELEAGVDPRRWNRRVYIDRHLAAMQVLAEQWL